jgi:ATP-dependent Clp protease ATP-binding subunit ClpB
MAATEDPQERTQIIMEVVKASLRPELYNRISQVIPFNALSDVELKKIVDVQLAGLRRRLADDRDIQLEVSPEALAYLAQQSYDPAYGARPVGRTMQQLVLSPVATAVITGEVTAGQTLHIGCSEEALVFSVPEGAAATR